MILFLISPDQNILDLHTMVNDTGILNDASQIDLRDSAIGGVLRRKKQVEIHNILYTEENEFNSIILESPYTSMEKAAKLYYPYLPVKFLLKDKYNSEKKIKNIKTPILIMHGKKDDVVPFKMGVELFEKANQPKFSYFSENDDHMMEFNDQLINSLKKFLIFNPK